MWLVSEGIIGQSRPYPAPVCYGGTGTGSRAKPVLIRFPSAVEPVSVSARPPQPHYGCGADGDRQSRQQRVVDTPGANGLHRRSAVPLAWRWRGTRQVPNNRGGADPPPVASLATPASIAQCRLVSRSMSRASRACLFSGLALDVSSGGRRKPQESTRNLHRDPPRIVVSPAAPQCF